MGLMAAVLYTLGVVISLVGTGFLLGFKRYGLVFIAHGA